MWTLPVWAGAAEPRSVTSRADVLPIEAMSDLASRGDIALIETDPDGRCAQVVLFGRIGAPPERVWRLLMDVHAYPDFMDTMESTRIVDVDDGLIAYRWTAAIPPLLRLSGTRLQRGHAPSLVEVRGHDGALRGTRERFELFPIPGGTLAAFHRSLDVETGGLLMRSLMGLDPSMEESMTLASLLIHLQGVRRHLAGGERTPTEAPPEPPVLEPLGLQRDGALRALAPLLELGTLAVVESRGDGTLQQVAVLTMVDAPAAHVRDVVLNAEAYPEFIRSMNSMEVHRRDDGTMDMSWRLSVPMTSLEGKSRMAVRRDGSVDIWTLEGDIANGRWKWEFFEIDAERSVPVHYVYSDLREASFFTRVVLDAEPMLEHGLIGASGTVALGGMKARSEATR